MRERVDKKQLQLSARSLRSLDCSWLHFEGRSHVEVGKNIACNIGNTHRRVGRVSVWRPSLSLVACRRTSDCPRIC